MAMTRKQAGQMVDATRLWMPIGMMISVILFVIATTYGVTTYKADTQNTLANMSIKIDGLSQSISDLNTTVTTRAVEYVTKTELRMWCFQARSRNPSQSCPAFDAAASDTPASDAPKKPERRSDSARRKPSVAAAAPSGLFPF